MRRIFYGGDVTAPPQAGDKFIQIDWNENDRSLDVRHGVFPEGSTEEPKIRYYPTLDKLHEAIQREELKAQDAGLKLYTLPYVLAESRLQPDPTEETDSE